MKIKWRMKWVKDNRRNSLWKSGDYLIQEDEALILYECFFKGDKFDQSILFEECKLICANHYIESLEHKIKKLKLSNQKLRTTIKRMTETLFLNKGSDFYE
jgi:hypothetical protein